MKRFYVIITIFLTHLIPVFAQQETDEFSVLLDTVNISAVSNASSVRTMMWGEVKLDMEILDKLPKIMGNADPVSYSRMLPGVQTSGEYNGGLHINGSENSHNMISILDVPLYNVNHLLGFFSTFIPTHYSSMSLYRTPATGGAPNRLGGELVFSPDYLIKSQVITGIVSIGLMSSQGTLKIPIGDKSFFTASVRGSYINLLYSSWLDIEGSKFKYSFYDSNFTWACNVNEYNVILADIYCGQDKLGLSESGFKADVGCRWGNDLEAFHWIHDGLNGFRMKHTLYHSSYRNNFDFDHESGSLYMPSGIYDIGYRSAYGWRNLSMGADAIYHDMTLQSPVIRGTYNNSGMEEERKYAWEYSVYGDCSLNMSDHLNVKFGLRGNLFRSGDDFFKSVDPSVTTSYMGAGDKWSVSLNLSQRHQFFFQTGLTGSGMPTEFWMPAYDVYKPQFMRGVTLTGNLELGNGCYSLSSSVYYKRLYNQLEYYGSIIDFLTTDYSVADHLICGEGYNYGFDIMLSKNTGNFTGWVSYGFGRAMRHFDIEGMDKLYPASHERIHELDMVAIYKTGKRWEPSLTFVCAGGTPFTSPDYLYMINRNIFIKYGDFNASRLNPYIRMDVSVNYDLKTPGVGLIRSHGLNLSLYNVFCRGNDLAYILKVYNDRFYMSHISFLGWVLPSISYYCRF